MTDSLGRSENLFTRLWKIRDLHDDDRNFIIHSWIRSTPRRFRVLFDKDCDKYLHDIIQTLFETADWRIACSKEDEDQVFGWLCYDERLHCAHYAYVKSAFRGLGMCRDLTGDLILLRTSFRHPGFFHAPEMLAASMVDAAETDEDEE